MKKPKKSEITKSVLIKTATGKFLEKGFSNTTIREISNELRMSPGHIIFYFPSKEHMLAVLADMLCDYQWQMMKQYVVEGHSSLAAACLEITAMAAVCEENEVARDFYISCYNHPLTLEIIRRNDADRSKLIYEKYCRDWTMEQFNAAEIIVSGIEYSTMMSTPTSPSLEIRIRQALNTIMSVFGVPEEVRNEQIETVLALDYREIGKSILSEFRKYINETNEQAVEELMEKRRRWKEERT